MRDLSFALQSASPAWSDLHVTRLTSWIFFNRREFLGLLVTDVAMSPIDGCDLAAENRADFERKPLAFLLLIALEHVGIWQIRNIDRTWLDIPLGTEIAEDYQVSLSTKARGDVFTSGETYAVPSMPCVGLRSSSGAFRPRLSVPPGRPRPGPRHASLTIT